MDQANAQKRHRETVESDIVTLKNGIHGELESYPGQFAEAASRLAELHQKGDGLLEQMLGGLGNTADALKALFVNREIGREDGAGLHTVKYQEDGTILIKNPSARVVIVSLQLGLSSAPEKIRLGPGQTVKIQPTITSRFQTWEEWSDEAHEHQKRNAALLAFNRDEAERPGYGHRWNETLGFGGGSDSSSRSH